MNDTKDYINGSFEEKPVDFGQTMDESNSDESFNFKNEMLEASLPQKLNQREQ